MTATSTLIDNLRKDTRSLHLASRRLVSGNQRLLLLVNRLKNSSPLCKDEKEQQAFVDNLLHAAQPDGVVTLILTLPRRLLSSLRQIPGTAQRTGDPTKVHWCHEQRRAAPRHRRASQRKASKWEFQEGLVEQLLADVGDEPGALPLLSHALLETWKRRSGRWMTLAGLSGKRQGQGAIARVRCHL